MKVSRRIAQFLLVLLEYGEPKIEPRKYGFDRVFYLQHFFYGRMHKIPGRYGIFKVNITLRSSFNRTIRIMSRQGLISMYHEGNYSDIVLTEKGKKTATALKEEALRYIEDFSFLLDRKTSSATNVRN